MQVPNGNFFFSISMVCIGSALYGNNAGHDALNIADAGQVAKGFRDIHRQLTDFFAIGGKDHLASTVQGCSGIVQCIYRCICMKMYIPIEVNSFQNILKEGRLVVCAELMGIVRGDEQELRQAELSCAEDMVGNGQ